MFRGIEQGVFTDIDDSVSEMHQVSAIRSNVFLLRCKIEVYVCFSYDHIHRDINKQIIHFGLFPLINRAPVTRLEYSCNK